MSAFLTFTKAQFSKLEGTELPFPVTCHEHDVDGISYVQIEVETREHAEHLLSLRDADKPQKSNPSPAPSPAQKVRATTMTPTVPNVHRDETLRKAANDPQLRDEIEKAADRGCRLSLDLAATWSEPHAQRLAALAAVPTTKRAATVVELDAATKAIASYVETFAADSKIDVVTAYGALASTRDAHYLELLKRKQAIEQLVHPAELEHARHTQAVAAKRQHDAATQTAATEAAKRAASDPLAVFNAAVADFAKANGIADEGDALVKFLGTPDGIAAKRAYDSTRAYSR